MKPVTLSVENCVFDNLHGYAYSAYHFSGMQTRTLVLDGEEDEGPKSGEIVP